MKRGTVTSAFFFMRGSNNAYALPADGLPQYHNWGSIEQ